MFRIGREKKTVEMMIRLYCRRKENNAFLCTACESLMEYACKRLDSCPFGEQKTSCKSCRVHCYRPDMRQRMQAVMRFAGPRMILYHPWIAIRHLLEK